jgi:SAM-dependent methyltransferase
MISIVCVYNNETILNDVMLKSLKNQTVKYELILLDNAGGRFKSAASALNFGGSKATGDYIMFIHQDMWLGTPSWIEDAENYLSTLPDVGIAGVLGIISTNGPKNWEKNLKYSINFVKDGFEAPNPVERPERVESLDECLLIVPREVFKKLKFDDVAFDGWDCYAPDYCLAIKPLGLKAYVVPGYSSHYCLRSDYMHWEFKDLLKYQRRLYQKYKKEYKTIHTALAGVSWRYLQIQAVKRLVVPFYYRIFPNLPMIIEKELAGCKNVLDIGCGSMSPLSYGNFQETFGVDRSYQVLLESKRHRALKYHILGDIRHMDFKPKSFDAIIAVNILEYLTREEGEILLTRMVQWARQKILIVTKKSSCNENRLPSDWQPKDFYNRGYIVRGLNEKRLEVPSLRDLIANIFLNFRAVFPEKATSLVAIKEIRT